MVNLKPTYEGLKPQPQRDTVITWYNLKPTYEGLKQSLRSKIRQPISNLKPTYEGLKPLTPVLTATCGFI